MRTLIILLLLCGVAHADVSRQIITVDENFKADKEKYFMCEFHGVAPHTVPKITNSVFEKCNLFDVEPDGTNILKASNLYDSTYVPPLEGDEARIKQLEDFIKTEGLIGPTKVER